MELVSWVLDMIPPVILGSLLKFSVPPFLYLSNGDSVNSHIASLGYVGIK